MIDTYILQLFLALSGWRQQQTTKPRRRRCRNARMLLEQKSSTNKEINLMTQSITLHITERTQWVPPSTQRKFFMLEEQRSRGGSFWNFWGFSKSWLGRSGFVESIKSSKDINMRIDEIFQAQTSSITLHNYHIVWNHNNKNIKGSNCSNTLDEND